MIWQSVLIIGSLILGFISGYFVRLYLALRQKHSVEAKLRNKIKKAEEQADEIVKKATEQAEKLISESREEIRKKENHLGILENRILKREEALEEDIRRLKKEEEELRHKQEALDKEEKEIASLRKEVESKLEKISGLSREEAKRVLWEQIKKENREEFAHRLSKLIHNQKEEIEKKSVEIITTALQRYARSHIAELTTTTFPLADEELKGKIIGREGRNIRTLERATGVEIIIDETPDSIVISSFDPYRRELAKLALEKLIKDGRIQPVKIEEKVEEARQELNRRILEIGEEAASEVGIYDLPKEIIQLLGRLYFRTSYGQNVLNHSIEMAHLAGMIAADLGLDIQVAKKGALLHDIGKALDQEVEGTHVEIGMKILRKYGIDEKVIQAMQSHHEDYPYAIPEAFVVSTADILSAARPGARRGTLESYIKRLVDLERIAKEFPGVQNAYAISAGRELRIFVMPEKVDDFGALELAKAVANRIQSELKYPGEIKVNVIRELRAVEYAR